FRRCSLPVLVAVLGAQRAADLIRTAAATTSAHRGSEPGMCLALEVIGYAISKESRDEQDDLLRGGAGAGQGRSFLDRDRFARKDGVPRGGWVGRDDAPGRPVSPRRRVLGLSKPGSWRADVRARAIRVPRETARCGNRVPGRRENLVV